MNISLTPQLEELVKGKVESGRYHCASEVLRDALCLLEERDQLRDLRLEQLRREIQQGIDSGEATPLDIQEVKARGASVIAVGTQGDHRLRELVDDMFEIPPLPEPLQPILATVPLQLLAYHTAVLRGCNVDRPRNLAKSVTVE